MGYRYRLYRKNLPGKPDLVFAGRRKAIFVHGCFWHGHECKRGARVPKTNTAYWLRKVAKNKARDDAHYAKLETLGWRVLILWECEVKQQEALKERLTTFLDA